MLKARAQGITVVLNGRVAVLSGVRSGRVLKAYAQGMMVVLSGRVAVLSGVRSGRVLKACARGACSRHECQVLSGMRVGRLR